MYGRNVRIGGPMTLWVKRLMIINGVIFLFQLIFGIINGNVGANPFDSFFGLIIAFFGVF